MPGSSSSSKPSTRAPLPLKTASTSSQVKGTAPKAKGTAPKAKGTYHYEASGATVRRAWGPRAQKHVEGVLSSGRAIIAPVGEQYALTVRPDGSTRPKKAGTHASVQDAMRAVLAHFPLPTGTPASGTAAPPTPTPSASSPVPKKAVTAKKTATSTTKKTATAPVSPTPVAPPSAKNYHDVGTKIGGARKDIEEASARLSKKPGAKALAELETLDPDAAARLCVKAKLWPKETLGETVSQWQSKGGDAGWAFLLAAVHSTISPRPQKPGERPGEIVDSHSPLDRARYESALRQVRELLEGATSGQEGLHRLQIWGESLKKCARYQQQKSSSWRFYADSPAPSEEEQQGALLATCLGEKFVRYLLGERKVCDRKLYQLKLLFMDLNPINYLNVRDVMKLRDATPEEKKKALEFGEKYAQRANREVWAQVHALAGLVSKTKEDAGKNGSASEREKALAQAKESIEKWKRSVPSTYDRKGGKAIDIRRPEDYLTRFGLRGVEFGNWMDDASSKVHVDRCAEAFSDLADAIGIPLKQVAWNGRLALAFGARGKGAAAAHYEPGKVVINLTKGGGAGTLGHEWGHFFDDMIGRITPDLKAEFASDNAPSTLAAHPSPVARAMGEVMNILWKGVPGEEQTFAGDKTKYKLSSWRSVDGMKRSGMSAGAILSEMCQRYPGSFDAPSKHQGLVDYLCSKFDCDKVVGTRQHSDYLGRCEKMGNAKYWASAHEMFARAFECFLEDRLAKSRRANNYLVCVGKTEPGAIFPFPEGKERAALYKAFSRLVDAVKEDRLMEKALKLFAF